MMLFGKKLKKPDPEAEKKLREDIENAGGLEKKDLPAMILAAYLVIIPVVAVLLFLFVLLAYLFL